MAVHKNGIIVIGAVFVDIKGFPEGIYLPTGRNAGKIKYVHGGVSRNVVEDIANIELRPTFLGIVDDSALGGDVIRKLQNHKVIPNICVRFPMAWEPGWPSSTTTEIWPVPSPSGRT